MPEKDVLATVLIAAEMRLALTEAGWERIAWSRAYWRRPGDAGVYRTKAAYLIMLREAAP